MHSDRTGIAGSNGWRTARCLGVRIIFEASNQMNLLNSKSVQQVGIFVLRVLACLVLVAAITWIAFSVLNVNALIVGFAYVLAVLVVAARWGLTESFVTSVAAMLCLNYYFLPPILTLSLVSNTIIACMTRFACIAIRTSSANASCTSESASSAESSS